MTLSYADEQRERNPVAYEKARLVIDVTDELKLAMEDSGITLTGLAEKLGRTKGGLSRQLSGSENMTLGKIAELAYALGRRFSMKLEQIESTSQRVSGRDRLMTVVWSQPHPAKKGLNFNVKTSKREYIPTDHPTAA